MAGGPGSLHPSLDPRAAASELDGHYLGHHAVWRPVQLQHRSCRQQLLSLASELAAATPARAHSRVAGGSDILVGLFVWPRMATWEHADKNVRARAPVRALTWRGESPRQAEASPVCDRRLLRRGDTGWGAAGGELPVRKERFVKTRNKLNSIRPDGGTSLRALSEVRPVAHASTIGRASPRGGAGQRSNERMLKKTVSERKKLRHRRRVVGDRMAGSVSEISRETCRGTERRSWPERPEEPARQESERP